MAGEDGVEEGHVAGVGRNAGVQQVVLGVELAVGANPEPLDGLGGRLELPWEVADEALLDGMGALEPVLELLAPRRESLNQGGQRLGSRHLGHLELVLDAGFVYVEGAGHREDRTAVLNGHHPTGGEGATIADAVHLVEDGDVGISGAKEVGVQGVHEANVDRASRGHEGLGEHLTTEDPLALLVGLGTPEDVHLDWLEVEQVHEEVEVSTHVLIFSQDPHSPTAELVGSRGLGLRP